MEEVKISISEHLTDYSSAVFSNFVLRGLDNQRLRCLKLKLKLFGKLLDSFRNSLELLSRKVEMGVAHGWRLVRSNILDEFLLKF